ncbi:hypothetical protein F2Q69_00005516 [Brassica cretica]|uniref:GRF-type domain-containing protein n=1 Tax=Brassica cretica TaxID=69181 RepID=A0A8S9NP40_BRACR|nr:hypothetical protein F2Q69_00005516 [Brassica cretica]
MSNSKQLSPKIEITAEIIISSSSTEQPVKCACNLTTHPVRVWTRKNPGRRFVSCRGRRVGRQYVNCDIFQWADQEPPHGWQHLALLEARDIINEEKEELAKLRNEVSKQSDQNMNKQISNELVEKLNGKCEECEALKRTVLVLTERSSLLRNLLVGSSFGVGVVLGGFFGFYLKA